MLILKKNNHIDETKLNRNQSIQFIALLKLEMNRHKCERHDCTQRKFFDVGNINSIFWKCQEENHTLDINMIQDCIDYLVKKWSG